MSGSDRADAFALRDGAVEVELWRAADYVQGSSAREIGVTDRPPQATHLEVQVDGRLAASAVLLVDQGYAAVGQGRAVLRARALFVAMADRVIALALPALDVLWAEKVDDSCVFGLMEIEEEEALLVHGELEITRIGMDGRIQWQRGGADIFTGGCHVEDDVVVAVDWNGAVYRWRLTDGEAL